MSQGIDSHGLTDVGRVRERNEDQFLLADLDKSVLVRQTSLPEPDHTRLFGGPQGHVYAVADGMGGHGGGERASGLAVGTLVRYVLGTLPWFYRLGEQEHEVGDELRAAVEACQEVVAKAGRTEPGHSRMGTTFTLAYVLWPRLYVVHAGGSRVYLYRDGRLHQLTTDHTVGAKLIADGHMTPAQVAGTPLGHTLYKVIHATGDGVAADIHKSRLQPGDGLLVCSDGLHGEVSDARMAELMAGGTAEQAARRLVDAANAAGGRDNITAVVVRFPTTPPDTDAVRTA